MKAITSWEELKGKTIVDVIDEEILVFSDDTFAYLYTENEWIKLNEGRDLGNHQKLGLGLMTQEQYDAIKLAEDLAARKRIEAYERQERAQLARLLAKYEP